MFSRCYPTLSDFLLHHFGINIPLPIFSFGFFVALGFLAAAYILSLELKRKEGLGLLPPYQKDVMVGEPASITDYLMSGLLGFVLGFKILAVALDYGVFSANPQAFILSAQGNIIGGILGAALFAFLKYQEKKKEQLPTPKKETIKVHAYELTGDITLMAAIGGISGAKLFYLFETPGNFQEFISNPLESFFGGLTIYGGLIGGALVVYLFVKSKGLKFVHFADSAAPGLILAYGIGRMGCQVSGDGDWGVPNLALKPEWMPQWLWAQSYPHNIINEGVFIQGCQEAHCMVLAQPVYPTPIYELIMATVIFGILWGVRKKIAFPGFIFSLYMAFNGVERFFIEQYRVNTKLEWIQGINATQAEVIAILFVLVGMAGMLVSYKLAKK
jgi:phosphatidylglycerol:prolipoprotein diacylglycerol transferase